MSEPPPQYGNQLPPPPPIPPSVPFPDPADPLISPDYAGWVRRNVALVKAYWKPLAALQAIAAVVGLVAAVPTQIISTLGTRDLRPAKTVSGASLPGELGKWLAALGVGLVGSIVAGLVALLVTIAGMRLIVARLTGGPPGIGAALRGALPRLLPLVGWYALAGLLVLVGVCACLVPGLYLVAVFWVLQAVVLFERGGAAIGRCFKLFHADVGSALARVATVVGLTVAVGLASAAVDLIIKVPLGGAGTGGRITATVISTVFGVVVGAAVGVVTIPLVLTTYADERARLEPLHTGILAHELATS